VDKTHQRRQQRLRIEAGPDVLSALEAPDVIEILLNPDGRLWVESMGEGMAEIGRMPPRRSLERTFVADVLTPEQWRLNMSRIRGRDTKPELILRRGLHALGRRFRLHRKDLPGKPDLVFPGYRAVILVHGCFWHWHGCPMFKWPATREEFWREKIDRNRERDHAALEGLREEGWRVLVVWECALCGPGRRPAEETLERCEGFIRDKGEAFGEIAGEWPTGEGD